LNPSRHIIQPSNRHANHTHTKPQTDSSRAKALELEIQNRVAQELQRLREREQQTLAEIEKRIAEAKDTGSIPVSTATAPVVASSSGYPVGSLNLDAPRIPFAGREYDPAPVFAAPQEPVAQQQPVANREISRDSVMSEIDVLRSRLDGRRKLVELDESVEKAKADVVGCLRLNDRRPLDCWKEVDAFKKEVAKMEAAFVDRIVG
jgi:altered-inheritance-of-mitochondria protein 13